VDAIKKMIRDVAWDNRNFLGCPILEGLSIPVNLYETGLPITQDVRLKVQPEELDPSKEGFDPKLWEIRWNEILNCLTNKTDQILNYWNQGALVITLQLDVMRLPQGSSDVWDMIPSPARIRNLRKTHWY